MAETLKTHLTSEAEAEPTSALTGYLALERAILRADAAGDPDADVLRDLLDPIWRRLDAKELAQLDARQPADKPQPKRPTYAELATAAKMLVEWLDRVALTSGDTPWGAAADVARAGAMDTLHAAAARR